MGIRFSKSNPVFATQRKTGREVLSSHPVARGNAQFSPLLKNFLDFFFEPVQSPVNGFLRDTQIRCNFTGRISLYFHKSDMQSKPIHLNQHLIELLIFDVIQKVLNRFYFGLCHIRCDFFKVCTCFLHTLIVNQCRIRTTYPNIFARLSRRARCVCSWAITYSCASAKLLGKYIFGFRYSNL